MGKGPWTLVTLKALDVVVHVHVTLKVPLHGEASPTNVTREWCPIEVLGIPVTFHPLHSGEWDPTNVTLHAAWPNLKLSSSS